MCTHTDHTTERRPDPREVTRTWFRDTAQRLNSRPDLLLSIANQHVRVARLKLHTGADVQCQLGELNADAVLGVELALEVIEHNSINGFSCEVELHEAVVKEIEYLWQHIHQLVDGAIFTLPRNDTSYEWGLLLPAIDAWISLLADKAKGAFERLPGAKLKYPVSCQFRVTEFVAQLLERKAEVIAAQALLARKAAAADAPSGSNRIWKVRDLTMHI